MSLLNELMSLFTFWVYTKLTLSGMGLSFFVYCETCAGNLDLNINQLPGCICNGPQFRTIDHMCAMFSQNCFTKPQCLICCINAQYLLFACHFKLAFIFTCHICGFIVLSPFVNVRDQVNSLWSLDALLTWLFFFQNTKHWQLERRIRAIMKILFEFWLFSQTSAIKVRSQIIFSPVNLIACRRQHYYYHNVFKSQT